MPSQVAIGGRVGCSVVRLSGDLRVLWDAYAFALPDALFWQAGRADARIQIDIGAGSIQKTCTQ
ncbi:hypothetical protein [Paracoccus sp. Ld10]|uniref:hypothetical protein n=1 Tax=Paracoccus sp. Ld10 TaxID=649158 RepID=UPI00387015D1